MTFTNPAPVPVQNTAPAQPTTSSSPASPTAEVANKPETPGTKLVDTEGNELKLQEGEEKITFKNKETIVLSGTTVPNGEVKLYIFSEPQEATVTADETGAWSYTIASIEPGDHRVEVEVTDPATGETSERQEVLVFAVAQTEVSTSGPQDIIGPVGNEEADSGSITPLAIGGVITVVAMGGGVLWWIKRRKSQAGHYKEASVVSEATNVTDDEADPGANKKD